MKPFSNSQRVGFPDLPAAKPAANHLMKEAEQIRKVDPEPAIQTASIESPVHQRIVTFNHHKAFTSQTVHGSADPQTFSLPQSIHHQCQAAC